MLKERSLFAQSGSRVYSAMFARPTADHRWNLCSLRSHTDSYSLHSHGHRLDEEFASLCWTCDGENSAVLSSSSSSSSGQMKTRVGNSTEEQVTSNEWGCSSAWNEERSEIDGHMGDFLSFTRQVENRCDNDWMHRSMDCLQKCCPIQVLCPI